MDLLLLVVLLVFRLLEDLQQAFHLGLGFARVFFVLGHFLLQRHYSYRKFCTGVDLCCCTLSLEQTFDIVNMLSIF